VWGLNAITTISYSLHLCWIYTSLSSLTPTVSQAALEAGKCVVIGLQSTGEARTLDVVAERAIDGELDDFVSGPKVTASMLMPVRAPAQPAVHHILDNNPLLLVSVTGCRLQL
jgi:hypothetical protein